MQANGYYRDYGWVDWKMKIALRAQATHQQQF
jgi:hypothetical protein